MSGSITHRRVNIILLLLFLLLCRSHGNRNRSRRTARQAYNTCCVRATICGSAFCRFNNATSGVRGSRSRLTRCETLSPGQRSIVRVARTQTSDGQTSGHARVVVMSRRGGQRGCAPDGPEDAAARCDFCAARRTRPYGYGRPVSGTRARVNRVPSGRLRNASVVMLLFPFPAWGLPVQLRPRRSRGRSVVSHTSAPRQ